MFTSPLAISRRSENLSIAAAKCSRRFAKKFGFCLAITKRTTILVSYAGDSASWTSIARYVRIGSTTWAGLGYSNITPFNTPGEYTDEQIREALAAFDGLSPLYLVAHVPPKDSHLDEFAPGQHGGSPALRAWVEHEQPLYLFCGHIHECAGHSDQIGRTKCFNVGKAGYTLDVE